MATESSELAQEAQEQGAATAVATASTANDVNRKTLGEATAFFTAQMMANSNVQQQQAWQFGNAMLATLTPTVTKASEKLLETTATEGAGPDMVSLLALAKALQSVPPGAYPPQYVTPAPVTATE